VPFGRTRPAVFVGADFFAILRGAFLLGEGRRSVAPFFLAVFFLALAIVVSC
jgi:hypothetical protein